MKLVIGLGNPEEKYNKTRHNVGFLLIDKLKKEINKDLVALKSSSFMNDSGSFVASALTVHGLLSTDHLYIIHDDLDIKIGEYKIQSGKGPKDHNGIKDIEEKLGTNEFWRVRVGIENRKQEEGMRIKGEEYVLQDFTNEEMEIINQVIEKACKKLVTQ